MSFNKTDQKLNRQTENIQTAGRAAGGLVSISKAAKFLCVSPDTLRNWETQGKLVPQRTEGGARRYPFSQLISYKKLLNPIPKTPIGQLSVSKAARELRVSPDTIRNWDKKGIIRTERTKGGSRRFSRTEIKRLQEELNIKTDQNLSDLIQTDYFPTSPTISLTSDRPVLNSNPLVQALAINPDESPAEPLVMLPTPKQMNLFVKAASFTALGILFLLIGATILKTSLINKDNQRLSSVLRKIPLLASVIPDLIRNPGRFILDPWFVARDDKLANVPSSLRRSSGSVLAESSPSGSFLEINLDTVVNGLLSVKEASVSGALSVNNVTYNFPGVQGAASTFLQDDGSGNLTWTNVPQPGIATTTTTGIASFSSSFFSVSTTGAVSLIDGGITTTQIKNGTITNSDLASSSITVSPGSGMSGGGAVSLGGSVTLTNAGVTSITGTASQVIASSSTGSVTLTLPQNIATTSDPEFDSLELTTGLLLNGSTSGTLTLTTAAATTSYTLTLPSSGGTSGYVLTTDGAGNTSWISASGLVTTWDSIDNPVGNQTLAMAGNTTTWNWATATTGNQFSATANALTSGTLFNLSSTSTAGTGSGSSYLLNLSRSGANSNATHTAYGIASAVTNTGTTGTNIAGYFSASGATNNYAGIFAAGNVGIGDITPSSLLEVGDGTDSLQVSSVGDVTFVDANDGASITGPAGGALLVTAPTNALNLQSDGSIDVNIAGGAGATGCTVNNTTGALNCAGSITGGSSGVAGYWNRTGTTISPATSGDSVDVGNGGNFTAGLTTGKIGFGGAVSGSDYMISITGDSTQDWSRLIDITQANNADEDSSVITIANTVNLGSLGASRSIKNSSASLTPTATIPNSRLLTTYGSENNIDSSNITHSTSTSATVRSITYGSYNSITGTPIFNDATGADETIAQMYGVYGNMNITPTLTNVTFGTLSTWAGFFSNASSSAGDNELTNTSYGILVQSTGNLTTTGTTTHYGGHFTASGTADDNYGLYVSSVANATNNYGLRIETVAAASTNYAIYSNAAAQSYFAGNVGIGTTTPAGKLDVTDTSNTAASFTLTNNTATTIGNGGNTLGVIDLQSTSVSTGNFMNVEVNGLTTGTGINLSHTTSVIASGGSLARISSTSVDTGTTTGVLLDLSSTGSTAGTQVLQTYSALATGIGESIVTNALSTGTAFSISSSSTAITSAGLISATLSGNPTASWTGDLAKFEITGNDADIDGSALKVGVTASSTAGSASTALNVTSAGPSGAFVARFNDDGTYTDTSPFVIDSTGQIGIGTTAPSQLFQVNASGTTSFVVKSDGNVGIGTTAPKDAFQISHGDGTMQRWAWDPALTTDDIFNLKLIATSGSGTIDWKLQLIDQTGGTKVIWGIKGADGNVGIGTTAPARTLDVAGTARITTAVAVTEDRTLCTLASSGDIDFTNGACGTSSRRYKENIKDLTYGLDDVMRLNPVFFNYIKDSSAPSDLSLIDDRTKRRIGFIAEDMQEVIPEVVMWENGQIESIDYAYLTALNTKALQQLNYKVENALLTINPSSGLTNANLSVNKITVSTDVKVGGLVSASNFALDASSLNRVGALAAIPVDSSGKVSVADTINALNSGISVLDSRLLTLDSNQASQSSQLAQVQQLSNLAIEQSSSLDEKVASTSGKLASLSEQIQELLDSTSPNSPYPPDPPSLPDLTPPDLLTATASATLANLNVTDTLSSLRLSSLDATISGTLKSLGESFLGKTTIAGDLSVDGTFSITEGKAINAFPILYMQNNPLAEKIDVFSGKITLDKDGTFSAQTIIASEYKTVSGTTSGSGTILAGNDSVDISSPYVKPNSRILITPTTAVQTPLSVTSKVEGQKFSVSVPDPAGSNITFDWLIINEAQK